MSTPDRATSTVLCDQAIFTSVRTPMGEGYRIIAATKGLRPEEKQVITRSCPSHDALIGKSADARALSFNMLPTDRLYVAYSCHAGAEHTGRGGLRVYTHVVVISPEDFEQFAYNPFCIWRAMEEAGLTSPQLSPKPLIEQVELDPGHSSHVYDESDSAGNVAARLGIIESLIVDGGAVVLGSEDSWELVEAVLLGIPGSWRSKISFGVGMKLAVGRDFKLNVLTEAEDTVRMRLADRLPVVSAESAQSKGFQSPWLDFIRRRYLSGQWEELAERTSRVFPACGKEGLDHTGRLYQRIEDTPGLDVDQCLAQFSAYLSEDGEELEDRVLAELLEATRSRLSEILPGVSLDEISDPWRSLLELWRRSALGKNCVQPIIERCLGAWSLREPPKAASLALLAAKQVPEQDSEPGFDFTVDLVLDRWAEWCDQAEDEQLLDCAAAAAAWLDFRPDCQILARVTSRLSEAGRQAASPS